MDLDYAGIAARLIIARTEAYLKDAGTEADLKAWPSLMAAVSSLGDDELKSWARVSAGRDRAAEEDDPAGRYLLAMEILGGDSVLQTLMELCIAEFTYPEFSAYLETNFGFTSCLRLASLIEGRSSLTHEEIHRYASAARRLMVLDMEAEPLQYAPVRADEKLMGFLCGSSDVSRALSDFTVLYPYDDRTLHEPFAGRDIIESGISHFASGGKLLCLTGRGGRRFIARHIAAGLSAGFLFVNMAELVRGRKREDTAEIRDALIREACCDSAGICLYGFDRHFVMGDTKDRDRGRQDMEALAGLLFAPLTAEGIPLILCVDEPELVPGRDIAEGMKCLVLPEEYSYEDRKKLWQGLFDLYGLKLDAASFASRYRMTPSEASLAVAEYDEEKGGTDAEDGETGFARVILDRIQRDGVGPGRLIYPDVRLGDVKLKDSVKQVLQDAVNAVLSGPVVLDEWGLRDRYPYGKGVSLLMSGPPGTGKTMSANAIAGELSLPLYQVNLSNTVDKYIGETEKNLEKAFSFAEKNNVILFFDEADAVFGTRSEVHDAKDRYANTEISYLLQRMEAYEGVVLMATNIKGNIDPAFMRRIRYVAHFEHPDEELRRAIWESCIADTVPHEEIDTEYLARQFDKFTGSIIKTVFLNACAKAAGEGERLMMKHLVYAIKQENEKESAVGFTMDTLGEYAYLV